MTDLLSQIMDYESGQLSECEVIAMFQRLVNSGMAWKLQGHYGRTAKHLIEAGYVKMPERRATNG
jgi:hypothetical protein